jgi:hypothetical protein
MLWWFVRTFRKTPFETIPLGIPLEELRTKALAGLKEGDEDGDMDKSRKAARRGYAFDESPLPDERVEVMNRMIRNNPSNMSQAIQSWLKQENGRSN